jgi:peptide/nickel transport system ATP-binding protein
MIAMAIACKPTILIADEPTTALDVTIQKQVIELLQSLQNQYGMSIIFITHDLALLSKTADEIAIMYQGKIVEQGDSNQVITSPHHPYSKALLACRPPLGKKLDRLPILSDFLMVNNEGILVQRDSFIPPKEVKAPSLPKTEKQIEVNNISCHYPLKKDYFWEKEKIFKAVDDVSFDIYKGETLGLVGESGCGKSTLGRAIIKLMDIHAGSIQYQSKQIHQLPPAELKKIRKEIQIVFQDPYGSLNPRMKIGEAIQEPMKVHKLHFNDTQRKEKTIELLERVGLQPAHYDRYPFEFSGGQRQRICIARALSVEPSFIICDESVSALDVSVQAQILNLLNQLKNDFSLTYLFISHDLSVIYYMSDRIIVMNNGKIDEIGTADEVFFNPKSEYTKKLLSSIPQHLAI